MCVVDVVARNILVYVTLMMRNLLVCVTLLAPNLLVYVTLLARNLLVYMTLHVTLMMVCTLSSPLSSNWCSFRLNFWVRLRLESMAMDKICARIVRMGRFCEGTGGC